MATTEIVVTIKCSNADKTEITCSASTTVIEFKKLIAEKLNIPAEQQRLIYKGRILKDENSLEQYGSLIVSSSLP
jgi:ubiquilin